MYVAILFVHSWLRWLVLGLGLLLLLASARGMRAAAGAPDHERLHKAFLGVLDTQMLLGLVLYFFLSPLGLPALSDFGAAMKDPVLRFFGLEHIVTMVLAVAAAHIGRARARRKQGAARHRAALIAQVVWLVLTLLAIPWPALDVGRPLLRL